MPSPASSIGLEIRFSVDQPVSLHEGLVRVPVSIENTTGRVVELSRYHETLDIYLIGENGTPITLTGGDAAIIREPIRIGPHQEATVDAQVQLEPCAGSTTDLSPGQYEAVAGFHVAEGGPTLYASGSVPVTVTD